MRHGYLVIDLNKANRAAASGAHSDAKHATN